MGRLVWVGVGAAGGIYTYRRGERMVQALQAQEAGRMVRTVASVGRRPRDSAMAVHPASGGSFPLAAAQAGLRVGRFRITRADEPAPAPRHVDRLYAEPVLPAEPNDGAVVDISEAATRRSRRAGVAARRRAR